MPIYNSKFFPESALAHRLLDGLSGIEIGGSYHNTFGLDVENVDFTNDMTTIFKAEEIKMCGAALPVDIVAPGNQLPLADKSKDFVISSHVIEHFFDPIAAIKEWLRVAKHYVYIICPQPDALPSDKDKPITPLAELLARHAGNITPPEVDTHEHYTRWTLDSFVAMCRCLGWNVIETQNPDDKVGNGFAVVIKVSGNITADCRDTNMQPKKMETPLKYRRIFMLQADRSGCGYARMELVAQYLNKHYPAEYRALNTMEMYSEDLIVRDTAGNISGLKYDLAILQRQYSSDCLQALRILQRQLKMPCVYELDDYMHGVHHESPVYQAYNRNTNKAIFNNTDAFLKESAAVTVTTHYLKKLYAKYNKHIYVLPNSLDFESVYTAELLHLREKHRLEHEAKGTIWLGWAGSSTHAADLRLAADAVAQILKDYPQVMLCLGGWNGQIITQEGIREDIWKNVPEERKIVIPWVENLIEYPKMLAHFDIGIAPLEDTHFNRAKSNIKLLEYGATGIAVIASDVEPYSKILSHGKNGLLVRSKGAIHADWYKNIKLLVENKELRQTLATHLHQHVASHYDMRKNIALWKDAYAEIIARWRTTHPRR
ncbi:MAG: glycosyltransferase [Gammaproteobacteria bacterium]